MIQGLRLDEDEAASELLGGLLDGSGGLSRFAGLDAGDPLSQLLASVQSRRQQREAEDLDHGRGAEPTATGGNKKSAQNNSKETVDECDRLFELMREAEREMHALERRCIAWRRLNTGRLADTGVNQQQQQQQLTKFEPSHCSACAATIAVQMLVLWLHLFQLDPGSVVITREMISLLLNDVSNLHLKNLQESKKSSVKEIAIHSKQGRPLVLEALKARLAVEDVNSAEIVGSILETIGTSDAEAAAPFVALAREALSTIPS